MEYKHLSQDERDDAVAQALIQREREHFNYELNRQNYITMLEQMADVPEVWPENLERFKSHTGEALAGLVHGQDYLDVTKLQFRDRVRQLLKTTECEQTKVETVYVALTERLKGNGLEAAVTRVKEKEAAKEAARDAARPARGV